ncbi:CRAL/TRIO domain-containing protein [Stereum hirsutum FP-91666 SS1]|uniref:CRAL/TRIO domain-containing protein n=1 Tax=Stereum hirsutum (strain FP-91666) TaxID=721885 RepID=UPI0004449DEA|nr:CRAL/TRIO domain-containing protein [Stereum hirsutum FP-91666 SS1]EIM86857.1 CRAL/TRIO domain-containing protein [Stereum hirsutum FP-91666 SS1]
MSTVEPSPTSNPPPTEVPLPAPTTAEVTNAESSVPVASEPAVEAPAKVEETASAVETAPPATAAPAETTAAAEPEKPKEAEPEVDEPQNALTKKFTEKEWAALKEFRKLLPEIFASAYEEKGEAKRQPIKIWGVTIDPNGKPDAKVSVVLMKWLRARNLNPAEAKAMMIATLRWRDEFKVDEAINETFDAKIFGNMGHVYGKDKEGRPVTYNVYGGEQDLKAVFGDVPRFLRWRVQLMEKGIEEIDFETVDSMVQVHDYEGVSMSSRDANSKQAASEASSIFQNHYPEFLSRKFFVNVPSFLTWIFWLFKPLLSAATVAKMQVVGTGPHAIGKALLPVVEKDQLPKRYGGDAEAF